MAEGDELEQLNQVVQDQVEEEAKKEQAGTTVGDVIGGVADVGEILLDGGAAVAVAVAEHAGDVAEAAVDALGSIVGGILDA